MMPNGEIPHPLINRRLVTYQKTDSEANPKKQKLFAYLDKLKKEMRILRQDNQTLQDVIDRLERSIETRNEEHQEQIERLEAELEAERKVIQTQALALSGEVHHGQAGLLRNPTTSKVIAEVIIESVHFTGQAQQESGQVIWAFRLTSDEKTVRWGSNSLLYLCLEHGPAICTRLVARPVDGNQAGLLEFL